MRDRIFVFLAIVALGIGCSGRQTSEIRALRDRVTKLEAENARLREIISLEELTSKRSLKQQVDSFRDRLTDCKEGCARLAKRAEEAGYYRGASDFNSALQVAGAPSSDGWWIFAEHYYTFQVRLHGNVLYTMTVETADRMPPVVQGLAAIATISDALEFRPSRPSRR